MDPIKEAFQKVKEDLFLVKFQIEEQKKNSQKNQENLRQLTEFLSALTEQNKFLFNSNKELIKRSSNYDSLFEELVTTVSFLNRRLETLTQKIDSLDTSTHLLKNSTDLKDISTNKQYLKERNGQIYPISTGNRGVPTDKQTNRQIDRQTDKGSHNLWTPTQKEELRTQTNPVKDAAEILDSLDSLKKEIRLKFKRLTEQELLVFSTIYQLEAQEEQVDYRSLAQKLDLTESSIRDYVGRLIKKGIPLDKIKINNKSIRLFISKDLKKVASLSTILHLRDL